MLSGLWVSVTVGRCAFVGLYGASVRELDHFKQVNDRHGHLVGDEVLRRFVVAAARSLRGGDRMGRYGGEEFLLLIDGATDVESARAVAERLRQATESQPWAEVAAGLQVALSVSVPA